MAEGRRHASVATAPVDASAPSTGRGRSGALPVAADPRGHRSGSAPPARRGGWRGPRARARALEVGFLAPAVVYLALFYGYPVVKNAVMGFQDYTTRTFFTGEAPWVGLDNFEVVLTSSLFSTAALNTLVFTVASIAGQFVLGLLIAQFFRRHFPLSGFLRSLLLLPWLVPLVASSASWRWILDQDHGALNRILAALRLADHPGWLTSTSLALLTVIAVNVWTGIPFNTTVLYGALKEIPEELYEAAALDGAVGLRAFRHITWPLLRPVVTVVLVLGVVSTLKVIDIILALTNGGPASSTLTIAAQSYNLSFTEFQFGQGAALGNVLIVVSLVFAGLYLRANRRAIDE